MSNLSPESVRRWQRSSHGERCGSLRHWGSFVWGEKEVMKGLESGYTLGRGEDNVWLIDGEGTVLAPSRRKRLR